MDISATSTATQTTSANASANSSAISSDFETFLKMLTAQMQNQDPLNPVDSSDYAVQLATFSSVEQQVKTNDLLTQLVGGASGSNLAELAGWVGMEARIDGAVGYAGSPVELTFSPPADAVRSEIIIADTNGAEVARLDASGTATSVAWTGIGASGAPVAYGQYSVALLSYDAKGAPTVGEVQSYARVTEVRGGTTEPEIVVQGGQILSASEVTALREAS